MKERIYHGDSVESGDRRLYRLYRKILARCYDPKQSGYYNYGGKNIKLHLKWKTNYLACRDWSYNNGYSRDLSIDRIDNLKDYSPQNCRWVTQKEQMRNTSRNVKHKGECALDASKRLGGTKHLVYNRIALGWSYEKAFTKHVGNRGRDLNLPIETIISKINSGEKQLSVANEFNVTQSHISKLVKKYYGK